MEAAGLPQAKKWLDGVIQKRAHHQQIHGDDQNEQRHRPARNGRIAGAWLSRQEVGRGEEHELRGKLDAENFFVLAASIMR